MSKRLEEAFDSLNEEETAKLLSELGGIRTKKVFSRRVFKKVRELDGGAPAQKRVKFRLSMRLLYAAAAVVLLAALGTGACAYAAEAKEYKAAKEFFMDNGLSIEGLSREEIKAVYRDITTESFTYDKTAEVIAHNLETNHIKGWEILIEQSDAESLSKAWERIQTEMAAAERYICDHKDKCVTESRIFTVMHESGTISKMIGDKTIWSYTSDKMRFTSGLTIKDGTLGLGVVPYDFRAPLDYKEYYSDSDRNFEPAVTKLDRDGGFVWYCSWSNGLEFEEVFTAVENDDGSVTVFSDGWDSRGLIIVVTRIDAEGRYLGSEKNLFDNSTSYVDISYAAGFRDGYLALIIIDAKPKLVTFDNEGVLGGEFGYGDEERDYRIVDFKVSGGKLFISAEADNKAVAEEISELIESGVERIEKDEFTPLLKELHSALLIVCAPGSSEPETFYEAKGSHADELALGEDGTIEWKVINIISAGWADKSGMPNVSGEGKLVKLVFDFRGGLLETVDNNEYSYIWW